MPRSGSLKRSRRLLWHPHQKLWNWELVKLATAPGRAIVAAIIGVDSVLLVARVMARRALRATGARAQPNVVPSKPQVLYIDCGVHRRGEQIRWMHRWFADRYELHVLGFDAGLEHVHDASTELADLDRVQLCHLALVGPDHKGDEVRIYKAGGEGKGDSLFGERGEEYDAVPACRLSRVLVDEGYDLGEMPVILRMNIEGAEQLVIEDLIAARLERSVDGYYGMWDDLSKVDADADDRFRRLLRHHSISSFTFNDRDLGTFGEGAFSSGPRNLLSQVRDLPFRLRRHAIRTAIEMSVDAGRERVAREAGHTQRESPVSNSELKDRPDA